MTSDTFRFEDDACYKVLKRWKVIDWCQINLDCPDEAPEGLCPGIWYHTQEIKVVDDIDPTLEGCIDVTVDAVDDCIAYDVVLTNSGSDSGDCPSEELRYEVCLDIDNDGDCDYKWTSHEEHKDSPFDNIFYLPAEVLGEDVSIPYDDPEDPFDLEQLDLEVGVHRVLWTTEDGCGNKASCETFVTVRDTKAPTPYCFQDLATSVMEEDGTITIWAIDFNVGAEDNCTATEDLQFSFSGDEIIPGRTFTCEEIENGVSQVFNLEIWVWDEAGNKSFCMATLKVDDTPGVCDDDGEGMAMIAGRFETEAGEMIEGVEVELGSTQAEYPVVDMTPMDGYFAFPSNPMYYNYDVSGEKNNDYMNGVSTLDMLIIQQHILGMSLLDSPYKVIAADINNDEQISALDLVQLRKLILGLYEELPSNDSWRFVDMYQEFTDIYNPWPFTEVLEITDLDQDMMEENFIGVKIGDVNGSVTANTDNLLSTETRTGKYEIITDEQIFSPGEEVRVEFRASATEAEDKLYGYQYTYDVTGLEYKAIEAGRLNVSQDNLGTHRVSEGKISTSWHKEDGVKLTAGETLFTLVFEATAGGMLSENLRLTSEITMNEVYTGKDYTAKEAGIRFEGIEDEKDVFVLNQNEPNPFATETLISFELPKSGEATITITDVTGKVVKIVEGDFVKGYNEITIKRSELDAAGLYYYTLLSGDNKAARSMLVIR